MANRVFILGSIGFPRGGAGANYDQYVALALKRAGWEVIILGSGVNRREDYVNGRYIYKEIEYWNEPKSLKVKYGISLLHYNKAHAKYCMSSKDYYIIRDLGWLTLLQTICKYGNRRMCYVHFEDVLPTQYNKPYINPKYWTDLIKWSIKQHKIKKSLPISARLEEIDSHFGCKCLRLPIMADPEEFEYVGKIYKPETIEFIYPGAKLNGCEDNIELMLSSFNRLTNEMKKHVKLHITGATYDKLKNKLGNKANELLGLKDVLIFHGWMDYGDLISLYQQMDFLILARYVNEATIANFPSKIPETLGFGIIPVCTKVGEYTSSYLVNGVNSIIFAPNSADACYAAIEKAINMTNDEYIQLRKQARKTALYKFGYKNWSEKLSDFLKSE